MHHYFRIFSLSVISLACLAPTFAAKPVDLAHQPFSVFQTFNHSGLTGSTQSAVKELNSHTDFNQTKHIRAQQTFSGFPVWGADAVVHIPKGGTSSLTKLSGPTTNITMDGTFYQEINQDLLNTPTHSLNQEQANKALRQAQSAYQNHTGNKQSISQATSDLMIYVDKESKAHWAYLVSFFILDDKKPAKPTYIMDALSFHIFEEWNNLQTLDDTVGGGFGGNERIGEYIYDGLGNDLPQLNIERDAFNNLCYLTNKDVTVLDWRHKDAIVSFTCRDKDSQHGNEYWDADFDTVNGGYSPSNDALFVGHVIKEMYQDWYGIPVLTKNGKPMLLKMRVHEEQYDNAYWDGQQMTFGDGESLFYPLVSIGVGAHEISHGFTEQHAGLQYMGQSGGLNESFSDMAAQAGEFYAFGKNSWQIGPEIFKEKDQALRYMDDPTKDCNGRKPGNSCSIDNVSQFLPWLDVHYSSGIFNKVFYLLGTADGWNTQKAFNVMVKANMDYWTSTVKFAEAACGVMKATKDYHYNLDTVKKAMSEVGINVKKC